MGIIICIIAIIAVILLWWIGTYNGIKRLDIKVNEGLSGIDVALTKRYDVLTKMLDVVKGYQRHEKEILTEVIKLRSGMTMQERNTANHQMDTAFGRINILAENYPELKSSNNFIQLQNAILDTEEHLQAARRLYNANVTAYNEKIVTFPNSVVASSMGATSKEFFEAEAVKRQDVKMEF
ncbi:MAG: LemA family protein [Lachnospiraceae bacterium]|nr:LemA family protein [Lachnospiraceae bacterium]